MQAAEAARIFFEWAAVEGVMPSAPTGASGTDAADLAQIDPITDVGKQQLRVKQIQAVGFNAPRNEIVVFLRRAAPTSKKALGKLPQRVDDVDIKYRQGVQDPIGSMPAQPFGSPPFIVRTTAGIGRYACGSSISVGNCVDAGTLGCLVRDANGVMYGLSNNHVSGSCNHAGVGLPILAPGVFDVAPNSLPPFTVGFHVRSLNMIPGTPDNIDAHANQDAAIFRVTSEDLLSSFQGAAYDTPTTTAPMVPDLEVEKVGRTTGHTRGRVNSQLFGPFPITYRADRYGFTGAVFFEPLFTIVGHGDAFSDQGDSGSLITAVDAQGSRHAIGIVLGGMQDGSAPGNRITLAMPIEPVLAALDVILIGGHNI